MEPGKKTITKIANTLPQHRPGNNTGAGAEKVVTEGPNCSREHKNRALTELLVISIRSRPHPDPTPSRHLGRRPAVLRPPSGHSRTKTQLSSSTATQPSQDRVAGIPALPHSDPP